MDQGKALEKITNENDYPLKIKNLVEELRYSREKLLEAQEKLRRDEKTSIL
jgi:hypothetical protein